MTKKKTGGKTVKVNPNAERAATVNVGKAIDGYNSGVVVEPTPVVSVPGAIKDDKLELLPAIPADLDDRGTVRFRVVGPSRMDLINGKAERFALKCASLRGMTSNAAINFNGGIGTQPFPFNEEKQEPMDFPVSGCRWCQYVYMLP